MAGRSVEARPENGSRHPIPTKVEHRAGSYSGKQSGAEKSGKPEEKTKSSVGLPHDTCGGNVP